ncbi:MAG: FAD-dependent oxidoreductase [Pseudomonadota bacterium]
MQGLTRRDFVAATGAVGLSAFNPAFAEPGRSAIRQDAPFAPLSVSSDRVARTVVGHRPYRSSGFVLKSEKVGKRTVVHNYGHGGCGVTLSWGCAELAVEEALKVSDERRAIVIGAGAVGLTTALTLLRRGFEVSVYGENLPPYTTSNIAGAYWHPTTLFDDDALTDPFVEQFRLAARLAQRRFQHMANDPQYGVYWMRHLDLREATPEKPREQYLEGDDLYPGLSVIEDSNRYFGYPYVVRKHALMIDPDVFLAALVREIEAAGGRIERRRFERDADIFDQRAKLFFNCTGLGARALFGDEELGPARGQLTMLLPQANVDYGYVTNGEEHGLLYMFPRLGSVVLGGTVKHGDWSTEPDSAEMNRMLTGHADVSARIKNSA